MKIQSKIVEKKEFYMDLPDGSSISAKTESKLKEKYKKWRDKNVVAKQTISVEMKFPMVLSSESEELERRDHPEGFSERIEEFFSKKISWEYIPHPEDLIGEDEAKYIFWVGEKMPLSVKIFLEENLKLVSAFEKLYDDWYVKTERAYNYRDEFYKKHPYVNKLSFEDFRHLDEKDTSLKEAIEISEST